MQLARETANKLERQTAQIEGFYTGLEDMSSSLDRSKEIISRMARHIASDKYARNLFVLFFALSLHINYTWHALIFSYKCMNLSVDTDFYHHLRVMWIFAFLVVAAIIIIIVWKTKYNKNANVNVP